MTRGQSAVIRNIIEFLYFEVTQRLFLNIKKIIKIFKRIYTTVTVTINKFKGKYKSNVRGLSYAYLVGLIEGDG
jgi:hypothetical protein